MNSVIPNQERGASADPCREEEKKRPTYCLLSGFYHAIYLDGDPGS